MDETLRESRLPIVVRSTELDVNGHVNNAKYMEYLEWGREDFYESAGLSYEVLYEAGVVTMTVNINLNYRKECLQNDQLIVVTRPGRVGTTSFTLAQTILRERDDAVVADAMVTLVTVDPTTRKGTPVPAVMRAWFAD